MFNFLMMNPVPVARFELPDVFGRAGLIVDTCGGINDSDHTYETAIAHPDYNDGKWIIVEEYHTKEDAQIGHEKWVKAMTADSLPAQIRDVSTTTIIRMIDSISEGDDSHRVHPRTIDITPDEPRQLQSNNE